MSRDGYRYGGQDHPPNNKHGREASPYSPGNPVVQGFSGISRTSSPILVVRKQAASCLLFRLSDIRGEILKKNLLIDRRATKYKEIEGLHPRRGPVSGNRYWGGNCRGGGREPPLPLPGRRALGRF